MFHDILDAALTLVADSLIVAFAGLVVIIWLRGGFKGFGR